MASLLVVIGALGGALLHRIFAPDDFERAQGGISQTRVVSNDAFQERETRQDFSSRTPVQPFHWSQLESKDYKVYIANLRAIGCPERTIRDIIRAEVDQIFEARHRQLEDARALQEIHDQRMAELQEVLTPEQLRQFELRESPTAEHLRHQLTAIFQL